jgi:hypothetical protein
MTTTDVNGVAILDNGQMVHLFGNGITDGTGAHLYVRDLSGNNTKDIGEAFSGRAIRTLKLHPSIGSVLTYVKVFDHKGGTVLYTRLGELSGVYENCYTLRGLNIPLQKGVYIFAMTAD